MFLKIKNIIISIIYILVLIYLLSFAPAIFGHKPLVVISGSMEPTLKVGSLLYFHDYDLNNYKKGDILVYRAGKHNISHRIVKRVKGGFITKGDANTTNDSSIVNDYQVLGKGTQWCIPFLGFYDDFIFTHKFIFVITIIILVIDIFVDKKLDEEEAEYDAFLNEYYKKNNDDNEIKR